LSEIPSIIPPYFGLLILFKPVHHNVNTGHYIPKNAEGGETRKMIRKGECDWKGRGRKSERERTNVTYSVKIKDTTYMVFYVLCL
jgi:hypothetical protein